MAAMLPVPRSRGALSGLLLILLGAWGALVPFIGPYFHYAYTPDTAWNYTSGRLYLEILPGAAALLGGLAVLASRSRPAAAAGAWLAAVSGAWFVAGGILAPLWLAASSATPGTPVGGPTTRVLEQIGFFTGLGVVIIYLAALALGRFTVVGVRDARRAERLQAARSAETAPAAADEEPAADTEETAPTSVSAAS